MALRRDLTVRSCRYGCSASSKRARGRAGAGPRAKQRALLALLALQPGQRVSADRLIDVLWGDGQAAHPANALQAQIGQLRRAFGPAAILTTKPATPWPSVRRRSTSSA